MKGYFFNAVKTDDLQTYPTGYDRNYSAEDFAVFFKGFFSDGVLIKESQAECLVKASGTTLSINAGFALIQGCGVVVEGNEVASAGSGGYAVIRLNKGVDVRAAQFLVVSAPVKTENICDLELARVSVSGGVASVIDTRSYGAYTGNVTAVDNVLNDVAEAKLIARDAVKVWPETSTGQIARTVTIDGVTSWNDVLNKPLFIRAAIYGTDLETNLNINSLGAKSLYFPNMTGNGVTATPPVYHWVRTGQVYEVVWTGTYLLVTNMQVRRGSTSYLGLLQLSDNVTDTSTEKAATIRAVKATHDKAVAAGETAASAASAATAAKTTADAALARTAHYGICIDAPDVAARTVTCPGFTLAPGVRIAVTFYSAPTSSTSLTLNVNGTGAKTVLKNGIQQTSGAWIAGATIDFIYDGSNWRMFS